MGVKSLPIFFDCVELDSHSGFLLLETLQNILFAALNMLAHGNARLLRKPPLNAAQNISMPRCAARNAASLSRRIRISK